MERIAARHSASRVGLDGLDHQLIPECECYIKKILYRRHSRNCQKTNNHQRGKEWKEKRKRKEWENCFLPTLNYLAVYLLSILPFKAAGPLTPLINLSPRQGLWQASSLAYVIDSCLKGNKSLWLLKITSSEQSFFKTISRVKASCEPIINCLL